MLEFLKSKRRCAARARPLIEEQQAIVSRVVHLSPAEFFAVVTEAFFERADVLRARHPSLYAELASFYRLDPAAMVEAGRAPEST